VLEQNAKHFKHRFAVVRTLDPAFAMCYLRFFNWLVKSLISMKESFTEDRVPGTSSANTFANLFAAVSIFCSAC